MDLSAQVVRGFAMKDNMNGKVSWNVFAYRFEDREQVTFEELCYQLFCRKLT